MGYKNIQIETSQYILDVCHSWDTTYDWEHYAGESYCREYTETTSVVVTGVYNLLTDEREDPYIKHDVALGEWLEEHDINLY